MGRTRGFPAYRQLQAPSAASWSIIAPQNLWDALMIHVGRHAWRPFLQPLSTPSVLSPSREPCFCRERRMVPLQWIPDINIDVNIQQPISLSLFIVWSFSLYYSFSAVLHLLSRCVKNKITTEGGIFQSTQCCLTLFSLKSAGALLLTSTEAVRSTLNTVNMHIHEANSVC